MSKQNRTERFACAAGIEDRYAQRWLLDMLANALWFPEDADAKTRAEITAGMLAAMEAIAPGDVIEAMLAAQMLAAHAAAMECLRRAHIPGQPLEAREPNLRAAQRFSALFARQAAVLGWRRAAAHPPPRTPAMRRSDLTEPGGASITRGGPRPPNGSRPIWKDGSTT